MSESLTVRISTQYYSLSIHRRTLKAIGDPEYIQFGYQPEAKVLMLVGNIVDEENSIRVHYNKNGSCIVFSKGLIEGMRRVGGVMQEKGSYLLTGRASDTLPIIYFELAGATPSAAEPLPVTDQPPTPPSDERRMDAADLPSSADDHRPDAGADGDVPPAGEKDTTSAGEATDTDEDVASRLQEDVAVACNA